MFSVSKLLSPLSSLVAVCLLVFFSFSVLLQVAQANDISLPAYAKDKHLGVMSCAGSTCHEASKPLPGSPVRQNEFSTWKAKDEHSKAYQHLKNKLSVQIAKNLGLAKPAHQSKVCLDCHADNVSAAQRGKRFRISDGVSCEACHGGSRRWLGLHISGEDGHKANLDNGLYPTEKPVERAKLCLSCHFGDDKKFVTHKIMGAGHPRLSFELDRFTNVQPAHYKRDKDYGRRKGYADGTQVWAIGQAVAVGLFLDKLSVESNLDKAGLFPELSLFDCQSCHHAMKNKRWTGHTGLSAGVIRLNDANLILLRHAVKVLHPNEDKSFSNSILALHRATTTNKQAVIVATENLRKMTRRLVTEFANHRFTKMDKRKLLTSIIEEGKKGRHADYVVAEQSVMALDAISQSLSLKLNLKPLYALLGGNPKTGNEDKISFTLEKGKMTAYQNGLKAIKF
ncbi:MAG: multiheme c-type cytochrome [Thiotrichaceae bacterium]